MASAGWRFFDILIAETFIFFCRNDGLFEISQHIKTEFDRNYNDNGGRWSGGRWNFSSGRWNFSSGCWNFSSGRWNCLVVPVGVASGFYYNFNHNTDFIFAIGELHIVMWRNSD